MGDPGPGGSGRERTGRGLKIEVPADRTVEASADAFDVGAKQAIARDTSGLGLGERERS
ncbi:hypothetical protein GCM10017710_08260 [Arthrobacter ramosus]